MVRRWRRRWRRAGRAPTAGTRPLPRLRRRCTGWAAATQAPGLRARRGALRRRGLGLCFWPVVCFVFFFLNQGVAAAGAGRLDAA